MSNTTTPARTSRLTLAQLDTRMAALEAAIARLVEVQAPASPVRATRATTARKAPAKKASPKAARKAVAKAPVQAPASKGSRAKGEAGLTRSQWNKTLTAKARLAGKAQDGASVYSHVIASWAQVQELRAAGATPDSVLAKFAA